MLDYATEAISIILRKRDLLVNALGEEARGHARKNRGQS